MGNISDSVDLPAGGSVVFTATCSIDAGAVGTLSNTATVTAPAGVADGTAGNNSSTDSNTVLTPEADLSITKDNGSTQVLIGGQTIYTIVGSNAGPSDVIGATITDSFPGALDCSWTCSGAGGGTCARRADGGGHLRYRRSAGGRDGYLHGHLLGQRDGGRTARKHRVDRRADWGTPRRHPETTPQPTRTCWSASAAIRTTSPLRTPTIDTLQDVIACLTITVGPNVVVEAGEF